MLSAVVGSGSLKRMNQILLQISVPTIVPALIPKVLYPSFNFVFHFHKSLDFNLSTPTPPSPCQILFQSQEVPPPSLLNFPGALDFILAPSAHPFSHPPLNHLGQKPWPASPGPSPWIQTAPSTPVLPTSPLSFRPGGQGSYPFWLCVPGPVHSCGRRWCCGESGPGLE